MGVLLSSDARQSQNADVLLKIQQPDSVAKTVLNVDVVLLLEKSAWSVYATFDISLPQNYWINRRAPSAVWVSVSGSFRWSFVELW